MTPTDVTRTSPPQSDFAVTRTSAGQSTCEGKSATAPADSRPFTLPGYDILELIGRGGMGLVYKALQLSLHRLVAVKTIRGAEVSDPVAVGRFLAEAEAEAELHHPHVVQVYELGQHDGVPYLAMEYLPGGSLADRLATGGAMPPDAAAALVEKIARGVNAAHDHGVIHRDVKPANVLFDELGEPRVTDFGLAKRSGGGDLTRTQAVMGTPNYMAPEQAGGRAKFVGPPADVWALGVILYECLTARRPFDGESVADVLDRVQHSEARSVRTLMRSLPQDLDTICRKAMAKEPAHRYQTAGEFADDLHRFLAGEPIKARPLSAAQRVARWARRHPSAAALVAVCVLAAVVIGVGGWVAAAGQRAARQEAERNADDARDQRDKLAAANKARTETLDRLLINLDDRLKNLDGAEAVRKDFTGELARYADQLAKDQGGDADTLRLAARVHTRHAEAAAATNDDLTAAAAYRTAADLTDRLLAATPDDPDGVKAAAAARYGLGGALALAGRHADARAAYQAAAEWYGRATHPRAGVFARRSRSHAADALALSGGLNDAAAEYAALLKEQQAFTAANPTDDDAAEDVAVTATALGLATDDPAHLRAALAAYRTARAAADLPRYKSGERQAFADLGECLERLGRHADLMAMADEYTRAGLSYPEYNAACFAANAARCAAARGDREAAEKSAAAAVRYVAKAAAGDDWQYDDRVHMEVDPDMDPLRGRDDFRAVLAKLDQEAGKRVRPSELLARIKEVQESATEERDRGLAAAATFAERRRSERPRAGSDFAHYAALAVKLADDFPESPSAPSALTWVLETADTKTTDGRKWADAAVAKLSRYVGKAEFEGVCKPLAGVASERADKLLEEAAAKLPAEKGRAFAAYYLAVSLAKQSEVAAVGSPEQKGLFGKAEAAFERVVTEFGKVKAGETTFGAAAKKKLSEFQKLAVGRPAPEVSGPDLDGQPMTLSDFRGKVVLLDFWANWCGFCRDMYPAERAMVARYADRPFALVGVNCDRDAASVRRAVSRERINWRSWYDGPGGPICDTWQVDAYPQMVLIDGRGTIRRKWRGRADEADIQKAIDDLLAEAAATK